MRKAWRAIKELRAALQHSEGLLQTSAGRRVSTSSLQLPFDALPGVRKKMMPPALKEMCARSMMRWNLTLCQRLSAQQMMVSCQLSVW